MHIYIFSAVLSEDQFLQFGELGREDLYDYLGQFAVVLRVDLERSVFIDEETGFVYVATVFDDVYNGDTGEPVVGFGEVVPAAKVVELVDKGWATFDQFRYFKEV